MHEHFKTCTSVKAIIKISVRRRVLARGALIYSLYIWRQPDSFKMHEHFKTCTSVKAIIKISVRRRVLAHKVF